MTHLYDDIMTIGSKCLCVDVHLTIVGFNFDRAAKFCRLSLIAMAPLDTLVPRYGPCDLKSATVLITGGSSGIGLGLAQEFLKAGSTVIITGRREGPLKEAQAKYPKLHYQVNDVSKAEERQKLSQWAIKEFPQLNMLVNNAGIQV